MRTAPRRPRRAASGRPPEASCRRRAPDLQPGRSVPSRPADAQSSSSNGTGRRVRMKTRCPSTTKSVHRVSGISVDELRSLSSKLISHGRAPKRAGAARLGGLGHVNLQEWVSFLPRTVARLQPGSSAGCGVSGLAFAPRSANRRPNDAVGERPRSDRTPRAGGTKVSGTGNLRLPAKATAVLSPASPRSQAPRCCRPRAPCPIGRDHDGLETLRNVVEGRSCPPPPASSRASPPR